MTPSFTENRMSLFIVSCMFLLPVLFSGRLATAQEFRGSITGQVTDKTGSGVPRALVTVTNTATNVSTTTTTDQAGNYNVLYLTPGGYSVTVEAQGFKKLERQGIELRVADRLTLDLGLEVGGMLQEVKVVAQAPLLEAASASTGQVIDQRRITELPLSDGNPFTLERLAPGISYTGDLKFSRPFDNAGTSSMTVNGAPGGNEFSLDGSPNMANGNRVAFVPPSDAVAEFKIVSTAFDAQQGHTGGADVNVVLKSGTNSLHGTLYEFDRNTALDGNDFFLNRAGKPTGVTKYNRYGGSVGGPVWLPKHYDGRNKTFFFFAYEGLRDAFPEPTQYTVPTQAERYGDLSALLPGNKIYDPATGVLQTSGPNNGRVQRSQIQCNGQLNVICPNRLSLIAQAYLKFYPLPNQAGDSTGKNNLISNNPRSDTFDSENARVDHTLSSKQKLFARFTRNWRRESRGSWTGVQNGIVPTGNFLYRVNHGANYDHLYTFSPTTLLDVRVGFSRFLERNVRPSEGNFNAASLGFSPQTVALFKSSNYLPRFTIDKFSDLGDSVGDVTTFNIYSVQPTLTKIVSGHSLRIGYDFRAYRENNIAPGAAAGTYTFNSDFTKQLDNSSSGVFGQGLAAFLLGQPTGGQIDQNANRSNQTLFHAAFFQDDWKVAHKLTLNLGLRYEVEGGTTERYNRNLRGFDFTDPSPIEAAARAAYAQNPIPEVLPANFHVLGGPLFAQPWQRSFWKPDYKNFQPRIGAAYQLNPKTVLRGGWGIFGIPFILSGVNQSGFSQSIPITASIDTGVTFRANLFNPFPGETALPPGSSQGLATFIGRGIGLTPLDRPNARSQRWDFSIQREMPGHWLLEAAYVGNNGYDLGVGTDLDSIPRQFLSTSPMRDDPTINFLSTKFPNPFLGLAPGSSLNIVLTQDRSQLLKPFPQFSSINSQRNDGSSIYHSGQLRAEKRFTHGYTLLASYTWSKLLEQNSLLNSTDTQLEKRITTDDITHRVVVSGLWEFPFGRGRKWGANWHGVIDQALGGWQTGAIFQAQSGRPVGWGNLFYSGDPSQLRATITGSSVDNAFDKSGFYPNGVVNTNDSRIKLSNNIRYFPSRLPNFRGQGLNLWDISMIKNFTVTERVRLQFRGEFLNAFNHPQFNDPNLDPTSSDFTKVTSQNNLARNIQLALKLTF